MFFKPSLFKEAKKISLTPSEKLSIHEDLKAFMQAHPVRVTAGARQVDQKTSSNFLSSFHSMMLKPLPITLSALLLLGGGTAFAAEQSLPSDILYPVKIQVNERVRATFTPTSQGKAKWEARVAERRLEEAEKLALEKKLTGQTQVQVETNFDEQAKLVQEKIMRLKAEGNIQGAIELSNNFQASLRAHETILTQLDAQNSDAAAMDPLLAKIKLSATLVSTGIQELGTTASTDTQTQLKLIADKKRQTATDAVAAAKQRSSESAVLSAEMKIKIATVLQVSLDELSKGNDSFTQADFKGALSHYDQAEAYAQEILILIKGSQTLRLDTLPPLQIIESKDDDQKGVVTDKIVPPAETTTETKTDANIDTQGQTKIIPQDTMKKEPIFVEPKVLLDTNIKQEVTDTQTIETDKAQLELKQDTSVQDKTKLDLGL